MEHSTLLMIYADIDEHYIVEEREPVHADVLIMRVTVSRYHNYPQIFRGRDIHAVILMPEVDDNEIRSSETWEVVIKYRWEVPVIKFPSINLLGGK